jgi:hypothetical protein
VYLSTYMADVSGRYYKREQGQKRARIDTWSSEKCLMVHNFNIRVGGNAETRRSLQTYLQYKDFDSEEDILKIIQLFDFESMRETIRRRQDV